MLKQLFTHVKMSKNQPTFTMFWNSICGDDG